MLLEGGAVVSFGFGHRGQLGLGDEENRRTPTRINSLMGQKALQVSAGLQHSLVLLDGGGVVSFGYVRTRGRVGLWRL